MTQPPAPNDMPDEIYLEADDGKFHIHEADSDIALNPACQKYITKYIRADLRAPVAAGGGALNWKRQKDTVFAWAAEHGFTPVESEIVDLLSALQQPPATAVDLERLKEEIIASTNLKNAFYEISGSAFINGEKVSKEQAEHMRQFIYKTACQAGILMECEIDRLENLAAQGIIKGVE